jgi:Bax protein
MTTRTAALAMTLVAALMAFGFVLMNDRGGLAGLEDAVAYDLAAVRDGGRVPPRVVRAVDADLAAIPDLQQRKDLFIRLLLPAVLVENRRLRWFRDQVRTAKPIYVARIARAFGGDPMDMDDLLARVDAVPPSLALAQAAVETGWGTSRFLRQGNSVFGQRSYHADAKGLVPRDADGTFKVVRFVAIRQSVRAYMHTLNTHAAYAGFRRARAARRAAGEAPDGLALARHLGSYSERGAEYVKLVEDVIRTAGLSDFDGAALAGRK